MSNTKNPAIKNITAALLCVALAIGAGCTIKIHRDKKAAVTKKQNILKTATHPPQQTVRRKPPKPITAKPQRRWMV